MKRSLFPAVAWLAAIAGLLSSAWGQAVPPAITLYDKDPKHPWNRAYAVLMARAPEPEAAANDLLEGPFFFNTQRLLTGESNRDARALLREISDGEVLPERMSPQQRAVMQRDLLNIFHWLAENRYEGGELTSERRALGAALARAIRSVALTKEEILKLPDNYAAALAAPGAVTVFDAGKPGAFLPPDLLTENGAWLTLKERREISIAGMAHFRAFGGRSQFEVRLRHPEGRAAGEAYLKKLADLPHPYVKEKPASLEGVMGFHFIAGLWPNPETPQFPPGTMWALIRRAVLADNRGEPVTSPLVENIQIRVYRAIEPNPVTAQTFFEWELRRTLLLGKGGFHLTTPADEALGFLNRGIDIFETKDPAESRQVSTTLSCVGCHFGSGIHSVQSRSRAIMFGAPPAHPPEFTAASREEVRGLTDGQSSTFPSWVLLRWLWPSAEK